MPTPLVVVGGSAGSLPGIQEIFKVVPPDCGYAYVVIQHMSTEHKSHLDDLIGDLTKMPVTQLLDASELAPDQVYVCLPGQCPIFSEGVLHYLQDVNSHARHHSIDGFCCSLPTEVAASTTLVILSGTGQDGTEGAVHIKQAGGRVIIQDPTSATFSGMPLSVLDQDLADLVLAPDKIAEVIGLLPDMEKITAYVVEPRDEKSSEEQFHEILKLVKHHTKQDMEVYKPTTLRRRISRRMALQHLDSYQQYMQLLQNNHGELQQLAKDLLIGVTAFYRDPEAFKIIEEQVVPALCHAKGDGEKVRVWVAGCSTGEEAYSVAILFMDWFAAKQQRPRLQVFATDIDDVALELARAGIYPIEALANLESGQVMRHFSEDKNGYRINKAVRESIVFASHNLTTDPPFSKLDLVVCRNLLIYLNPVNQRKLLSLFHFVLNPGGYLFLGSSENIGNVARHFEALSKQWRIYRHTDSAPRRPPLLPISSGLAGSREIPGSGINPGALGNQERYYRQLLETHGPAQVLINTQHQLLFVSGDVSRYLTIPIGQASFDLFKIARPELSMSLRSAISQALEHQQRVAVSVSLTSPASDEHHHSVRIEVVPIRLGEGQGMLLVCFSPEPKKQSEQAVALSGGDDWILQQLVQELNATREDLHRTIEQSRASNEEMRAANEEVMAMNEELQSANEELESSKEELQSLNEELATSNSNLDAKVAEVEALNSDLLNLLRSAESATLLLDEQLLVRHYTPACTRLFRIIPSDQGRPLDDIVRLFKDSNLHAGCAEIIRGQTVPDREVQSDNDGWYLRRLLPYKNSEGVIKGVVLSLFDITGLKQADAMLQERATTLQWQANLLSRAAPVLGRDFNDRIMYWNKGAELLYGWREQEVMGQESHQILQTRFSQTLDQIRSVLFERGSWKGELTHRTKSGSVVVVDSQWTLYRDEIGEAKAIVEVNNDITERKQIQQSLREQENMFHTMVDWTYNWEYWLDPAGEIIYMSPSALRITGYTAAEFTATPKLLDFIIYDKDRHLWERFLQFDIREPRVQLKELKLRITRKNGEIRWINNTCRSVIGEDGRYLGLRLSVQDISDQIEAEEQIRNLAYYDPLTNLPNRRLVMDRLQQGLITSTRSKRYCALMLIDLDNFKQLNDTQGHEVGDQLLMLTAKRLAGCVRMEDTLSRLGGDEFVVLLENLAENETQAANKAEQIAEGIRQALDHTYVFNDSGTEFVSTTSIGITLFQGMRVSAEILLKQADLAMYQAKDAGRNAIRFFNPAMQAAIDSRIELINNLRHALESGEFRIHYQPQYDGNERLVGAEALLRWASPDHGLVPPGDFIHLAEETGLILRLGQWVLDSGLYQLKAWEEDDRFNQVKLSVNVSAKQFLQKDFADRVAQSLSQAGCNPRLLILELTESLLLESPEEMVAQMNQLNRLGVGFALDDFGTGCSSLFNLKWLPLVQLKIDQSFVSDITEDTNDAAIIKAILAMSDSLGLEVVAEGVETEAQRDFLKRHGCQLYQGYLFARPMSIEAWNTL